MSEVWTYLQNPVVETWSNVLLHFLWQGFLIAALTSVGLRLLRLTDSRRRYLVTLGGMICMATFPLATFFAVLSLSPVQQVGGSSAMGNQVLRLCWVLVDTNVG